MKKRTKKFILTVTGSVLVCVMIFGAAGYLLWQQQVKAQSAEIQIITKRVIEFGKLLQNVPILAEREVAGQAIEENYADFISPELLAAWKKTPSAAPGRLTSSPWPDRIEISSIKKDVASGQYKVVGEVIEITSADLASTTPVSNLRRTIRLNLEKKNNEWIIVKVF